MPLAAGAVAGTVTSGLSLTVEEAAGAAEVLRAVETMTGTMEEAKAAEVIAGATVEVRATEEAPVLGPTKATAVTAGAVVEARVAAKVAGLETTSMLTPSLETSAASATSLSLQLAVISRRSSKETATLPAVSATLAALP